jgi:aerobic carbon-monoxide dehydrogenase medium subunit
MTVKNAKDGLSLCEIYRKTSQALKKRFSTKSLEGMTIPADGMNLDIDGSAEHRTHLVGVLARRAVAEAIGK